MLNSLTHHGVELLMSVTESRVEPPAQCEPFSSHHNNLAASGLHCDDKPPPPPPPVSLPSPRHRSNSVRGHTRARLLAESCPLEGGTHTLSLSHTFFPSVGGGERLASYLGINLHQTEWDVAPWTADIKTRLSAVNRLVSSRQTPHPPTVDT